MQKQTFTQRGQLYPSSVKADPRINLVILGAIFLGVCIILDLITWIISVLTGSYSGPGMLLSTTGIAISSYITMISSAKKLEQKRQAAAYGDQRLLANIQPMPNTQAIPLPITIAMRPRLGVLLRFPAFVVGLILFLLSPELLALPLLHLWLTPIKLYELAVLVFVSLAVAVFVPIFRYIQVRKQITLTEQGIIAVGIFPKIQTIPWHEVRLFTISTGYYPNSPVLFELASTHEVIQWHWLRRHEPFYPAKPVVSPDIYDYQMNSVLEIIRGKTGLPLYDLRKKL